MEIEKIRKRIANRQQKTPFDKLPNVDNDNNKDERKKNGLLGFVNRVLIIFTLILGFFIYAKNDEKATFIKDIFGYQPDFSYVNNFANGIVGKILDYGIFDGLIDRNASSKVDALPIYVKLQTNKFTNEDGKVYCIGSGKVALVGETKDKEKMIIVKTVKNVIVTYVGVNDVFVFENDWVDNNNVIASFDNKMSIYFSLNGQSLTYEEVRTLF